MADINLTAAVRSNLSSLQSTASLMAKTSDRLSTGNKVNTALDNPTNFFTASSLNSRAGDLNNLMDSMANGIKTIEAANNGLTAITKNLEAMQSTLRQARQDKSFETKSFTIATNPDGTLSDTGSLSFSGGAVGSAQSVDLTVAATGAVDAVGVDVSGSGATFGATGTITAGTLQINGRAITIAADADQGTVINAINAQTQFTGVTADDDGGQLKLTNTTGKDIALTGTSSAFLDGLGFAVGTDITGSGTARALGGGTEADAGVGGRNTLDKLVSAINTQFDGKIRASNDNGKLRVENLSTTELTIAGATADAVTGAGADEAKVGKNAVRTDLATQFNDLRDQLDKLSDDASFNGINLLRGDNLKITFNETGTSAIDIRAKDGTSVNSANLSLTTTLKAADLDSDEGIDTFLDEVKGALNKVRSQASAFGSNLSIVQNRQDFTKSMINTLETGAGNLTLADMNQEAANMMALQTRQSLASSTLSMANQSDQGVLQLLR